MGGVPEAESSTEFATRKGWVGKEVVHFGSFSHTAHRDFTKLQKQVLSTDKDDFGEDVASSALYLGHRVVTLKVKAFFADLSDHRFGHILTERKGTREQLSQDRDAYEPTSGEGGDLILAFYDEGRLGKYPAIKVIANRGNESGIVLIKNPLESIGQVELDANWVKGFHRVLLALQPCRSTRRAVQPSVSARRWDLSKSTL